MEINASKIAAAHDHKTGTLLFVADFVRGNPDVLDFACKFAEMENADLQLLHVVDIEHAHSSPDAYMGAQFNLEMHAHRAKALKRSAMSLLSFGSPENEIPRRAAEVNASLVVLPVNGPVADRPQERLVQQLRSKCACPVLALPSDLLLDHHANFNVISQLLSLIRQTWEGDRRSMRGLRAFVKSRSQVSHPIMTKSEHVLRSQSA